MSWTGRGSASAANDTREETACKGENKGDTTSYTHVPCEAVPYEAMSQVDRELRINSFMIQESSPLLQYSPHQPHSGVLRQSGFINYGEHPPTILHSSTSFVGWPSLGWAPFAVNTGGPPIPLFCRDYHQQPQLHYWLVPMSRLEAASYGNLDFTH